MAFKQPAKKNLVDNKYSLPQFIKFNYLTGEKEKEYLIYEDPGVFNYDAGEMNGDFYTSFNAISPDRTLIAMFMTMIPQINVLEIETGLLKGITLSGNPGFSYLRGPVRDYKHFYNFSDVDNEYIYGLYTETSYAEFKETVNAKIVNVFNWDGTLVKKYYLENGADQIKIDSQNKLLYAINFESLDLYCYRLKH